MQSLALAPSAEYKTSRRSVQDIQSEHRLRDATMRVLLLICCLPLLAAGQAKLPLGAASRPCWAEVIEHDKNRDSNGNLPPGAEPPKCDSQGFFLAKQCRGALCFCVEPDGKELRYSKNRGEANSMFCRCAIEEAEIQRKGAFGPTIRCDSFGNYHPIQCTGSVCYCVQPHTGQRRFDTGSVNIGDLSALNARCAPQSLVG